MVSLSGNPGRYERRLVWVGRDGRVEPLAAPPRAYKWKCRHLAGWPASGRGHRAGTIGLWLYDFVARHPDAADDGEGKQSGPALDPDGTHIVYRGTRAGSRNLWWKTVDDTMNEERLTTGERRSDAGIVVGLTVSG